MGRHNQLVRITSEILALKQIIFQTRSETNILVKMTPMLMITLVSILPSAINSLPESVSSSCSSQTCQDCLGSCDGCDSCNLCKLCPEGLSICSKCKYCKNGAEGCKKSCATGKKDLICKKCIEDCPK